MPRRRYVKSRTSSIDTFFSRFAARLADEMAHKAVLFFVWPSQNIRIQAQMQAEQCSTPKQRS